jgi:hypothetical protein
VPEVSYDNGPKRLWPDSRARQSHEHTPERLLENLRRNAPGLPLTGLRRAAAKLERDRAKLVQAFPEASEVLSSGPIDPNNPVDRLRFWDSALQILHVQIALRGRTRSGSSEQECGQARRALVDSYIAEVWSASKKRITKTDVWKEAGYETRTEFERWQRCDRKATGAADRAIRRVLTDKPHLK